MSNKRSPDCPSAIPTIYNGVQLKSRLEAQTAFLFDTFGIPWEYESTSFMLKNGISYMPDFYLPRQLSVVECRGYRSDKGEKQIEGFAALLKTCEIKIRGAKRRLQSFFIIGGNGGMEVHHNWHDDDELCDGILLSKCSACGLWSLGTFDSTGCRTATCYGAPSCMNIIFALTSTKGKLLLNGELSEEWCQ